MLGPEASGSGQRWPAIAVLAAAAVASALGLVSLLGWALDHPALAGLGSSRLPMAPASALLFTVHGPVLGLRAARRTPGRRVTILAGGLVVLATLTALALLVLSVLDVRSPLEHLGMEIPHDPNGVPVGQVAVATAACFLLAGLSALATLPPPPARSVRSRVAFGSAAALLGVSCMFLLAYLYGRHLPYARPTLYEARIVSPSLASVLGFTALGLGLLTAVERERVPEVLRGTPHASGWYLLAFAMLASATILAADAHYDGYARQYRAEVERQLSAVADLKVREIVQWRRERLGDGAVLFGHEGFSALVERYFAAPGDRQQSQALRSWLRQVRRAYQYDRVFLVDTHGAEVVADPDTPEPVAAHLRPSVTECLRSARVSLLDFHRDAPGRPVRLSVMVPIYADQDRHRPLGVVALRIDPAVHLYPALQRWPTLSRSAETLLVRREGDDVLFLNDLRFHEGAALSLRVPLSNPQLPAAMAIRGQQGIVDGIDYRGEEVIAALRPVPRSPWFLVARMDEAEMYAPLAERLWHMVILVATVLFGGGTALGLLSRRHRMHFYREQYEAAQALRASEARYRALVEHAPVAIFIDRQDRVAEVNQACVRLFGAVSEDQLLGKSPFELFHPESHGAVRERLRTPSEHTGSTPPAEDRIVRLDGTAVDVQVAAAPFKDREADAVHVVLNDITQRKKAEQALRASEAALRERNDELTRFTYTVSHDLKSPLVTVQTFVGYLEQDLAKQDAQAVEKDLGFVRTAARKMSRLLDDLLELSRVGRKMNPPQEVPLGAVVEEALSLVAGRIAARRARVEVTDEPVVLFGDRIRLVEVFQNLLDNAVKFMGEQPSPCVQIGVEPSPGDPVLFVRDNGAGIDPRHIAKLFGLFEKLDPKSEGTGVGLALVRRILETHGGRIWVDSQGKGHGACFRFTLPGTQRASRKDLS